MSKELLDVLQQANKQRREATVRLERAMAIDDVKTNLSRIQGHAREVVKVCEENGLQVKITDILSQKLIDEVPFDEDDWW